MELVDIGFRLNSTTTKDGGEEILILRRSEVRGKTLPHTTLGQKKPETSRVGSSTDRLWENFSVKSRLRGWFFGGRDSGQIRLKKEGRERKKKGNGKHNIQSAARTLAE